MINGLFELVKEEPWGEEGRKYSLSHYFDSVKFGRYRVLNPISLTYQENANLERGIFGGGEGGVFEIKFGRGGGG